MNILIVNVHSALNRGDAAIMRATVDRLNELGRGVRITVATNDPKSWESEAERSGIGVVDSLAISASRIERGKWRANPVGFFFVLLACLISALSMKSFSVQPPIGTRGLKKTLTSYAEADLILSCGGGNLYANRPLSPMFLLALLAIGYALALGKPVAMLPQSVGPIQGRIQRALAGWVIGRVGKVLLREPRSAAFLRAELGLERQMTVLPDLAFGLSVIESTRKPRGEKRQRKIGVTVLDWADHRGGESAQESYEETLASALSDEIAEREASVTILCQCFGPSRDQDDRLASRRLFGRIRTRLVGKIDETAIVTRLRLEDDPNELSLDVLIERYSETDLLVGSRMHSGILALLVGTPVLLLSYQPKADGVWDNLGLSRYCLPIDRLAESTLRERMAELLAGTADQPHVHDLLDRLREKATRWTEHISNLPVKNERGSDE